MKIDAGEIESIPNRDRESIGVMNEWINEGMNAVIFCTKPNIWHRGYRSRDSSQFNLKLCCI